MRTIIGLFLLFMVGGVAADTVVPVPPQACTAVVTCTGVSITIPGGNPPPLVCVPPQVLQNGVCVTPVPPPPPPPGTVWMYLNGVKTAAADFSGNSTNWFNATTAGYNGGKTDIKVSGGCFIPVWASNYQLPNPGWHYFVISMKPTSANAVGIHFEPRINGGDADIYPHIDLASSLAKYGPAPRAGVWASYKIPFTDLGVPPGTALYKAVLACDGATYEFDAMGFQ